VRVRVYSHAHRLTLPGPLDVRCRDAGDTWRVSRESVSLFDFFRDEDSRWKAIHTYKPYMCTTFICMYICWTLGPILS